MKKKRKFTLQKLLNVRELVEKERQKELSQSKQILKAEEDNLLKLVAKKDRAAQKMQELERSVVSRYQDHHTYLTTLHTSIQEKRNEIADIELEVEEKRQKLLDATKDRKALDKLKEKHAMQQSLEENKSEQSFIDQVAVRKNSDQNRNVR
ncbi:flagellar export protein FliJ [bacterium]|nr:flagellar export protein FliJ [bacterium]